jgi:hypothetical protein
MTFSFSFPSLVAMYIAQTPQYNPHGAIRSVFLISSSVHPSIFNPPLPGSSAANNSVTPVFRRSGAHCRYYSRPPQDVIKSVLLENKFYPHRRKPYELLSETTQILLWYRSSCKKNVSLYSGSKRRGSVTPKYRYKQAKCKYRKNVPKWSMPISLDGQSTSCSRTRRHSTRRNSYNNTEGVD